MPTNPVLGLPGVRSSRTATPIKLMLAPNFTVYPGGKVINGSLSRDPLHTGNIDILRAGVPMGRITATGKYAPAIIGKTTANYTSGGTSLTVSAATATELVRRVGATGTFNLVHAPTAGGTVAISTVVFSAVNTTTGVITVADIGANVNAGALLGASDGSYIPRAFVGDGFGIKVTDDDGTSIDVGFVPMVIGGVIDVTKIVNYPDADDTTLITWFKLTTGLCDHFQFSDEY